MKRVEEGHLETTERKLKNVLCYIENKIYKAAQIEFGGIVKDLFNSGLENDIREAMIKSVFEYTDGDYIMVGRLLKAWCFSAKEAEIGDITKYAVKEYMNTFVKYYESNKEPYNEIEHIEYLTEILKKKPSMIDIMRDEIENVKKNSTDAATRIEESLNKVIEISESKNVIEDNKAWQQRVQKDKEFVAPASRTK